MPQLKMQRNICLENSNFLYNNNNNNNNNYIY